MVTSEMVRDKLSSRALHLRVLPKGSVIFEVTLASKYTLDAFPSSFTPFQNLFPYIL